MAHTGALHSNKLWIANSHVQLPYDDPQVAYFRSDQYEDREVHEIHGSYKSQTYDQGE